MGSKVGVLIAQDKTDYRGASLSNFGETLTVKVRDIGPEAFKKLSPMQTELAIVEVERATIYGQYRNELSIIAAVEVAK